jgi:hypothetical protein
MSGPNADHVLYATGPVLVRLLHGYQGASTGTAEKTCSAKWRPTREARHAYSRRGTVFPQPKHRASVSISHATMGLPAVFFSPKTCLLLSHLPAVRSAEKTGCIAGSKDATLDYAEANCIAKAADVVFSRSFAHSFSFLPPPRPRDVLLRHMWEGWVTR